MPLVSSSSINGGTFHKIKAIRGTGTVSLGAILTVVAILTPCSMSSAAYQRICDPKINRRHDKMMKKCPDASQGLLGLLGLLRSAQ